LEHACDQLREFAVAKDCGGGESANRDLVQDLASGGKGLDEDSLFVGDVGRNWVEIFERESEIFGEGAIVSDDAEDGAPVAVRLQAAAAEIADEFEAIGGTRNVDFPGDTFADPAFPGCAGDSGDLQNLSDEFMAGDAKKMMVAAKDFDVSVADARQVNANERPAVAQSGQRPTNFAQFSFLNDESEHAGLLF
jgi:hypothetical protein